MFLKKSLLFTTALALLIFAGQASSQSVSLTHVPGEGGTEGMAAGSGTTITVKISQTGVNDIPGISAAGALNIVLAFDMSLVSLPAVPFGLLKIDNESGTTLTVPAPPGGALSVPPAVDLTFTTVADVTDVEFSIGITGAQVITGAVVDVPITASVTFNEGATGTPPGDGNGDGNGDNGDTGMPTPEPTEMSVSLTSGGESAVNRVGAGAEVVVDVTVSGVTAAVGGGKITFSVDPSVATITGLMPDASVESESSGLNLVISFPPMTLTDGNLGSVTFTTNDDYDGSTFSIGITSLELFTTGGVVSVAAGDPVLVNQLSFYLMSDVSEAVTVLPGGSGMATVTAMDVGDEDVEDVTFAVEGEGVEHSAEGVTVTLTASGTATATVTATVRSFTTDPVTVEFVQGALIASSDAEAALVVMPGGSNSATVTSEGQAEGATVVFALEEGSSEGVALDAETGVVSASGPGTAIVTAWVGEVGSNAVTVEFEWGPLTASSMLRLLWW